MTRSSVEGTLWGILLLAGCAESAIQPDMPLSWEGDPSSILADAALGSTLSDAGDLSPADAADGVDAATDLDAAVVDAAPVVVEDAATDAGHTDTAMDAGRLDAGTDAGRMDAGPADAGRADAGVDAAVDAGMPDAGPAACPTGTERCGTECVDLSSESAHCGTCPNQCTSAQVCTAGSCVSPPPTAAGCVSQSYGGHNYLFCGANPDDWVDARKSCVKLGLDLAVIGSTAENDFVKANNGGKAIWIGASDRDTEGTFLTVKLGDTSSTRGPAVTFVNWASGEPNNQQDCLVLGLLCTGDEDCVQQRADGFWNDGKCANTNAFVCESY